MALEACPVTLGFGGNAADIIQVEQTIIAGSVVLVHRGDTVVLSITGLGNITDRTKLWFTVKPDKRKTDAQAYVMVEETIGLLTVNGLDADSSTDASITVSDAVVGNISVTIKPQATSQLYTGNNFVYDVQVLRTSNAVNTLREGVAIITGDVSRDID